MKILHLSDTSLSGAPYRLATTYNKYSGHEARHIVWQRKIYNRVFDCDLVGEEMTTEEIKKWIRWADIIHFHNRWKRQEIFKRVNLPKNKPSIIQIHSPRNPNDIEKGFKEEVESKLPIAVIAQYHVRQWPELSYIVPNVIDIDDALHKPVERVDRITPIIAYAPSSPNGKGWDNKSYNVVHPFLKRASLQNKMGYSRLVNLPHRICLERKQKSHIGIDEVSTGSYHMSSLEFLSMGIACVANIDPLTEKAVKDVTGALTLPWVRSTEKDFKNTLLNLINSKKYFEVGDYSRKWMETHWNQKKICAHFTKIYEEL